LEFAVVTADGVPVSIFPLIRAQGPQLVPYYSFRRNYFEFWIEEELRDGSSKSKDLQRTAAFIAGVRRMFERLGCSTDDFLLACSPLAYQTRIPVAPDARISREDVYRELVESLKRYASGLGRPLAFLYVDARDRALSTALQSAGCQPVFTLYDNRLDLSSFRCFEEYLNSLSRTTRQSVRREIRKTARSDVEFHFETDFASAADLLSQLYVQTSSRHASTFFRHPPEFWTAMSQELQGQAKALFATQKDRIIGFSMWLENERTRDLHCFRVGRDYSASDGSFCAFWLLIYGPAQHAIERGLHSLSLGPANYSTKTRRGATQSSLYNWYWFPRRKDRWLLLPYLRQAGRFTRSQLEQEAGRALRIQDPQPRPDET
jgi:predicted N-acyltransferase